MGNNGEPDPLLQDATTQVQGWVQPSLQATEGLVREARHPYTVALLASVPTLAKRGAPEPSAILLSGDPPSPVRLPAGCRFHSRCWLRERLGNPERCTTEAPVLDAASDHAVACHFAAETARHTSDLMAGKGGASRAPAEAQR